MKDTTAVWVNPKAFSPKLKESFSKAAPFSHVLIKNVLKEDQFAKLKDAVSKEGFSEKECDLFHFLQSSELKFSKNKVIQEFYAMFGSKSFVQLIQDITKIKLAPGIVDTFAAVYAPTHFLLCHDDRLEGRKVAFIFYLDACKEGGALQLFSVKEKRPVNVAKVYQPVPNSLIIFEVSSKSFHAVEEVRKGSRMSIGGWFH